MYQAMRKIETVKQLNVMKKSERNKKISKHTEKKETERKSTTKSNDFNGIESRKRKNVFEWRKSDPISKWLPNSES